MDTCPCVFLHAQRNIVVDAFADPGLQKGNQTVPTPGFGALPRGIPSGCMCTERAGSQNCTRKGGSSSCLATNQPLPFWAPGDILLSRASGWGLCLGLSLLSTNPKDDVLGRNRPLETPRGDQGRSAVSMATTPVPRTGGPS